MVFALTYSNFTSDYTEFANTTDYPQITVERNIAIAQQLIRESDWENGPGLLALSAATAHLLTLWRRTRGHLGATGPNTGNTSSGGSTASYAPPPMTERDKWWASTTHGQMVLMLRDPGSASQSQRVSTATDRLGLDTTESSRAKRRYWDSVKGRVSLPDDTHGW